MRVPLATLADQLRQDVRRSVRGLRTSPGFAAAVIATLALGIGANAAMFSVVDRLMFRPYPYLHDPSTVDRVYLRWLRRGQQNTTWYTEYTTYLDLKRWTTSFSDWAAFTQQPMAIGRGQAARERQVATVSASFFRFFDARPALGRFFTDDEDTVPRGADVAVVSHAFWQSELGGRDVIGEVLQVNNIAATIVGVAPEGFVGVDDANPPAVFIPITTYAGSRPEQRTQPTYYTRYNWGWMQMMVRRRPGVTPEQASVDLTQAHVKSWQAQRAIDPDMAPPEVAKPTAIASSMKTDAGPEPGIEARTALWVTGVAVVVLLIACANVANLFLARALRRRREIAVRLALGVTRAGLLRESVVESLVLSLAGFALGVLVAQWGGAGIRSLLVAGDGVSAGVLTDWRTLGAAAAVALTAALLTGVAPVLLAGRADVAAALKAGVREGTYQRSGARGVLLVLQGALSVVLLVGAALFVRSLGNVRAMRLGYDAERVLFVNRNMRGMEISDSAYAALRRRLLEAAQAIPGVERASYVHSVPFWSTSATDLFVPGIDSVARFGRFNYQAATTDYFRAMGTRILRGRGFTAEDRAAAPRVAVVSEGMARTLWPNESAIGRCLRVGADTMPCTTVVGVAEDIVLRDLLATQRLQYYLPLEQYTDAKGIGLVLRMRGDPAAFAEPVRRALQPLMPGDSYLTVRPLTDLVTKERRAWQLGATMFVAFGLLALVVAGVGLYGVVGYNVAQRMHELGVRVALGASGSSILRLVVGQGVRFAAAGVVVGVLVALAASSWLEPLLFRQSARDPGVYAFVSVVLVVIALVASALPALRAARADPGVVLRSD